MLKERSERQEEMNRYAEEQKRLAEWFWLRLLRTRTESTGSLPVRSLLDIFFSSSSSSSSSDAGSVFQNDSNDVKYNDKGGGIQTRPTRAEMTATAG